MSKFNKPRSILYKKPGNRCLLCGDKVQATASLKEWSWWVLPPHLDTIVGIVHNSCIGSSPPNESDNGDCPHDRV